VRSAKLQSVRAETTVIGYDESEQLMMEPARYFVRVTRRGSALAAVASKAR